MQDTVYKAPDAPHPIDIHVGSRLRERRMLLSIPQDQLAKQTGITFQQVQKYESGRNRVSASRLFEFANILSVPVTYFFPSACQEQAYGLSDQDQAAFDGPERPSVPHWLQDRDTLELIRSFQAIRDPKLQKHVLSLVKQMAASVGE